MRRLAAFDIDGTLIRWQLYHALADQMFKLGFIKSELFQDIKRARMHWKRRAAGSTFGDYEKKLITVYEDALKSMSANQMETASELVFQTYKDQVYTFTRDLLGRLKKQGYCLLAISGSQNEIIAKIANYHGFDDYVGTEYENLNDKYTGNKFVGSFKKNETLKKLAKKHNLVFEGSIAVGDSASDISMLEIVENPIAFNPEKQLFEHASKKGWPVVIERKNMIYRLKREDGKYQLVKPDA